MNAALGSLMLTFGLAAGLALLRGGRQSVSLIAGIGTLLLGLAILTAPLERVLEIGGFPLKLETEWLILGRRFILGDSNRWVIGILYLFTSFLFFGGMAARTTRFFYAFSLATLGLVSAAIMVSPFVFSPIFLMFATMGAFLLLVTPSHPAYIGGSRLLVLNLLAMMLILVAGWLLEFSGVTGSTPLLARRVSLLLLIGFGILMLVPPFHIWLPAAARQSHPYALAFISSILQTAGVFFILRFLNAYDWLRGDPFINQVVPILGGAVIIFGALMALAQTSFLVMMSYALIADFGAVLVAIGSGYTQGFQIALALSVARVLGMALWALGTVHLKDHPGNEMSPTDVAGGAYARPLAATAAIVGTLTIAGAPLTAGFPPRWALINLLILDQPLSGLIVLFGMFIVGLTGLRWLGHLLSSNKAEFMVLSESRAENIYLGIGVALTLLLGILPQAAFVWVNRAMIGLANLVP